MNDYATIKWSKIPIPRIGIPYHVYFSWGGHEWHVRLRGGGVRRVRAGWARRKLRKFCR